jgi:hypothetical protein
MIRTMILALMAVLMLGGCTAKEIGDGVNDGVDNVKRVIRGTNT